MNPVSIWSPGMSLEMVEKQIIQKAYAFYRNKTTTANSLGIAVRTLDAKLEKYDLEDKKEVEKADDGRAERDEQLLRARGHHPSQRIVPESPEVKPRLQVEPTKKSSEEHEVSMSIDAEIQEMLSTPASASGSRSRRA